MARKTHAVIVITADQGAHLPEVHVHGDLPAHLIDLGLDEARRKIGTYEETRLERFLRQNGLKMKVTPAREAGIFRASLEASLRNPKNRWGLLSSSAEGRTPHEARRKLAELISSGILVINSCLPTSREIPVPDLLGPPDPEKHNRAEARTGMMNPADLPSPADAMLGLTEAPEN